MDTNTNTDTNANTNTNTKFRLLNLYAHNTWPTEKIHGYHVGPVKMGAQKAMGKYEVSQFPQSLPLADLKSQLANLTNERLTMQDIWIFGSFPCFFLLIFAHPTNIRYGDAYARHSCNQ